MALSSTNATKKLSVRFKFSTSILFQTSLCVCMSAEQIVWKHCGKRRNCSWRAVSPFPIVSSTLLGYSVFVKFKIVVRKLLFSKNFVVWERAYYYTAKKFHAIWLVNMPGNIYHAPWQNPRKSNFPVGSPRKHFFPLQLKIQDGVYRYESPTWKLGYPFSSLVFRDCCH